MPTASPALPNAFAARRRALAAAVAGIGLSACGSLSRAAQARDATAAPTPVAGAAFPLASAGGMPGPSLRRGVNLSQWFELGQDEPFTPAQLAAVKRAGFDHVRIPFDPEKLGWKPGAGLVMPGWQRYRDGVNAALAAGLDVIVDMHPGHELKKRMEDSRSDESAFVALWRHLALRLADTPAERVAIEPYNEPQYYGFKPADWDRVQARLLAAVRESLPRHTVLLTGYNGGSFEGLKQTALLPDPHVIWLVHFYLPYVFTHQGANWLDNIHTAVGFMHDVRWPASELAAHPPTVSIPHPKAGKELGAYRDEKWGAERVDAYFADVAAWAREKQVRLLCNEFGVIRPNVDPESRWRWIGDVRRAAEHYGIGWTIWAYTASFGIATRSAPGADPVLDPQATAALGLVPQR